MEAVSLVCPLFGALVLAMDAAPYFRWGDAGQHVEIGSGCWTDASCYGTAGLIQRCVERAQTGQQSSATERHSVSR